MIERFECHAACDGAVADHRYDTPILATLRSRHGHAERSADGRGGVSDTERVVLALRARGERSKSARLLDRVELLAAARQNLVWIGLMAHVPNQPVVRRIEDVVQGYRQFDGAEPGGKVPATGAHTVDEKLPQLLGELRQFRGR